MGALMRTSLARPGRTTRRAMTARWWTSSRSAQMLPRLCEWNLEAFPLGAGPSACLCLDVLMYCSAGLLPKLNKVRLWACSVPVFNSADCQHLASHRAYLGAWLQLCMLGRPSVTKRGCPAADLCLMQRQKHNTYPSHHALTLQRAQPKQLWQLCGMTPPALPAGAGQILHKRCITLLHCLLPAQIGQILPGLLYLPAMPDLSPFALPAACRGWLSPPLSVPTACTARSSSTQSCT